MSRNHEFQLGNISPERANELGSALKQAANTNAVRFPEEHEMEPAFPKQPSEKTGRPVKGSTIDPEAASRLDVVHHMASNLMVHATRGLDAGLLPEAEAYYPRENSRLHEIGTAFNDRRAARGLPLLHPDHPEYAGAILSGGYSQRNDEAGRNRMIERSMKTGDVQNHLSTKMINSAIENQTHPLEAFGRVKLRDYTGSQIHPHDWDGRGLGTGHTIDRWEYAAALNPAKQTEVGDAPHVAGVAMERRYRTHQAAHTVLHHMLKQQHGIDLAPPAEQALVWGGIRGSFDQ